MISPFKLQLHGLKNRGAEEGIASQKLIDWVTHVRPSYFLQINTLTLKNEVLLDTEFFQHRSKSFK